MKRRAIALSLALAAACSGGPPEAAPPAPRTSTPASSPSPTPSPPALLVAVKGDWGAGGSAQRAITQRMCEVRKVRPFSIVVTTGDNFYDPDGFATPATYWRPEHCLITAPGHRWRAAWGNHDARGDSTARVLGSAERYFRWSEAGVDFFVLDSNRPSDATQRRWLEAALAGSAAPVKIVVFHHPPYTVGGGHPSDERVRRSWVPIFERYDVTLVLSGHNHDYEHSLVNGIDYVVTGGGGASVYACERTEPWNLICRARHHFLLVEVLGPTVTVTAIDAAGHDLDRFQIEA